MALMIGAGVFAAPRRVVHIVVALADNRYQGIVPVAASLGDGDVPSRNLYWGAGYGVKTFFQKSQEWVLAGRCQPGRAPVLERCVFRHKREDVYLVADAYRGREIKQAVSDFLAFAAGREREQVAGAATADLVVYVGHDGLMDFALDRYPDSADDKRRDAIILACASKQFFTGALRRTGARPLLWTTGLMAPEAYVLEAALAGWVRNETAEQIRLRAAQAYDKYQHCGVKAARRLFATGW
jgi:hypothetical protein